MRSDQTICTSGLHMLGSQEITRLYDGCLHLLSKKGVKVSHSESLRILDHAGADVDYRNEHVRFPQNVIETALKTVPQSFTLAGRDERYDLQVPHPGGLFHVCPCTGNQRYVDPETLTHRDATLADVEEFGRFIHALDHIDIAAYPFANDAPPETTDIHALRALFQNTAKHIEVQPFSLGSIPYLFELALAVSGRTESLRERPVITLIVCALSPFSFKAMDMEGIITCCRHGVPIMACSLPSAGGTSPLTIAGTVLLASVEVLAMLVMSQIIAPGTPVIGCPLIFTLDMVTGGIFQSSAEAMLAGAAASEFIKHAFHIPTAPSVFEADSHTIDEQTAIESSLAAGLTLTGRTGDILLGAGGLDGLLGVSPVKLIIDDTLVSVLRRIASGIEVDEETMACADLFEIAPGRSFIERSHTFRHCREPLRPELFAPPSLEGPRTETTDGLYARALKRYRDLENVLEPQSLSAEVNREMDRILKRAEAHLIR
jgi:trimethylamine:corrinoid methyltransferase-like protein